MLDAIDAQSLHQPRRAVTLVVDMESGPDFYPEGEQDPNDKTTTLGTSTGPHGPCGLRRPGADTDGGPIVCRGNGGTKLHNAIADERHPAAANAEHIRTHCGDRLANTSVLDGNGHVDSDPTADGRYTASLTMCAS